MNDDGRPVGTPAATDEVHAGRLSPSVLERLAAASHPGWIDRHRRIVGRAVVALIVTVGLVAALVAVRPPPQETLSRAAVEGVSIEVPPPRTGATDTRPIVATYRVGSSVSGMRFTVHGVTGPFIGRSEGRRVVGSGTGPARLFRVTVRPDCSDPASLDGTDAAYLVALSRRDSGGTSVSGRIRVASSPVDWGAAIRQDCWQQRAASGIHVEGLTTEVDRRRRLLDLRVSLRSTLPEDIRVRVIDIADVSTIDAADSGTLRSGATHVFVVRWPAADCSSSVLPLSRFRPTAEAGGDAAPDLAWSVGPVGKDPAALVATAFSSRQLSSVGEAVAALCEPPGTSIRVTGAHVLPANQVVVDHTGVSITLRLAVVSDAPRVALGADPRGLTADARVEITHADVRTSRHRATAMVVWHARCSPLDIEPPPFLSVRIGGPGPHRGYAVILNNADLASTYASACGLSDIDRLRAAGWALPEHSAPAD
jgi:hypothetical protein